ncbi:MAG TPA: molybdopterin oxidoreductase family protein [Actinomycetota bacterium]|nr:molybdopterin oxidoreductase family protein [Actinomycetota bacterium]
MKGRRPLPVIAPGIDDFRESGAIPAGRWEAPERGGERLVPTHCPFCGVQCGMYLRVDAAGRVFGVEPRDHPINRQKLCPKGVMAYQQVNHPDRLLHPLVRDRRDGPLRRATWDEALDRVVGEIRRIQERYGRDAVATIGGASATTETAYLLGKFARVALRTRHTDYNGRLCMVSAAAANKLAFGIDRAANPWEDMFHAEVILVAGANVGETFPVMTRYLWGARDRGARLIVVDPRETPIARTADHHVRLRPGTDAAFFDGLLHVLDREGMIDEAFVRDHTVGWEEVRRVVAAYPPERVAEVCGIPAAQVVDVARLWGRAERAMAFHARGIEHRIQGTENCLAVINLVLATGQLGRRGAGYGTITGQGNGQGGREHGQKADQLPGGRDIEDPEARAYIARVWGIEEAELPGRGTSLVEMIGQMERGEIRGVIGFCNNPLVSLPHQAWVARAYDALEFHAQVDFFLSETAARADVVLPSVVWAEDEGTHTNAEGRVLKINKAADPPGEARPDWWIICEIARRLGAGERFAFGGPRDVFEELRVASRGGTVDYSGITYERLERTGGIAWPCPDETHPGTPRLFEDLRSYHPDGRFRFHPVEWREPAEPPDEEYPLRLTTGRTVAHYLSGNQTRRIPGLVDQAPRPWVEIHPSLGFRDGEPVRVVTRRGAAVYPALVTETIRPDTVFIPYHWPGAAAANVLTIEALDPTSRIPEYKVCACRLERAEAPTEVPAPPVPPGQRPYADEVARLADRRPPTAPQGRGTAEP